MRFGRVNEMPPASARREFGRRACRALHYGLLETPAQTPSGRTASQSEVAPAAVPCSVPFRWFAGTSTGQRKAWLWRISRYREFVEFRNSKHFGGACSTAAEVPEIPNGVALSRSMPARASRRVNAERTAGLARSKWRKCQCPRVSCGLSSPRALEAAQRAIDYLCWVGAGPIGIRGERSLTGGQGFLHAASRTATYCQPRVRCENWSSWTSIR